MVKEADFFLTVYCNGLLHISMHIAIVDYTQVHNVVTTHMPCPVAIAD